MVDQCATMSLFYEMIVTALRALAGPCDVVSWWWSGAGWRPTDVSWCLQCKDKTQTAQWELVSE